MKRTEHEGMTDGPIGFRIFTKAEGDPIGAEDPNQIRLPPLYCDAVIAIAAVPVGDQKGYSIASIDGRCEKDPLFGFMGWIALAHRMIEDKDLPENARALLKIITLIESNPEQLHRIIAAAGVLAKHQQPVRHGVPPRMRRGGRQR